KLTLAALEATLHGEETPVRRALHADAEALRARTEHMASALGVEVIPHEGRVGGGGGTGVPLTGWAMCLPLEAAAPLRAADPPILTRVHEGVCLLDLRCVPEDQDAEVLSSVGEALRTLPSAARAQR